MTLTDTSRQTVQIVMQFVQLIVMLIAVAGIFVTIGARNERLEQNTEEIRNLRDIAQDLAKTTVEVAINNQDQNRRLDSLASRLANLENNR